MAGVVPLTGRDPYRRYSRRYYRQARRSFRYGPPGYPYPPPWPGESAGLMIGTALARWCYQHRSAFRPFLIALAALIAGAIGHARHPVWWIPAFLVTLLVTTAAGIPHGWLRRYRAGRPVAAFLAWLWAGCGIGRPAERGYLAVVAAVTGGWLTAAIITGPAGKPMLTALLLATVLLGIPWWRHRGRRDKVRVERTVQDWPGMADNIGLPGSRILSAVVDRWGWTGRLALRKGTTTAQAIDKTPAIESALGVPPGTVRVTPDPARADRAVLRVIETDPHGQPVPWPGPVITSITQPATLGVFEDGRPVQVSLLRRNILVGGTTGSGKSGVVNDIMAILSACQDVAAWGVDLKGGMELQPWEKCLARPLATAPQEAIALFRDAVTELDRRAGWLTARGIRLWEPSRQHPALFIVVDEYAEMPAEAQEYADSISRRGRAVAVNLLAATQRPTQAAMGNGAVRSQMDVRICLRVKERRDADLILGQGSVKSGWQAHAITQPGVFLISAPEHTTPERALAYWLDDGQIRRHVSQHARARPSLPATAGPPGAPGSPQAAEHTFESTPVTPGPDAALWDALSAAGPPGVSVAELAQAAGRSRRWVYYRLTALAGAGRAIQTIRGRWRAAPDGPGGGGQPPAALPGGDAS
jgi:DNA segregation ATPase FtsK/SpoIIIE, S-DNA-T family